MLFKYLGDVGGSEDEQRAKLREIANKIDLDKNGQIYYDELRIYTEQRIKFVLRSLRIFIYFFVFPPIFQ